MEDEQIELYLKRIGVSKRPERLDLQYLTTLHKAHISSIPFENLDIMEGKPISLDREDLFNKIIVRQRGGVCSELNTLYNWLLASLGYEVVSYSSRIIAKTRPIQQKSHRIIVVLIDGERYITDVGFNYDHHRIPLKLTEDLIQYDGECRYRLTRDRFFGWIMWQEQVGLGWRRKIGFTEDPCIDMDFNGPTFFAENHEESAINKATKVALHINGEFYAVRGGAFLKEEGGVEHIIEKLDSPKREREILSRVFKL